MLVYKAKTDGGHIPSVHTSLVAFSSGSISFTIQLPTPMLLSQLPLVFVYPYSNVVHFTESWHNDSG